jgi:hypothetical protein
MTLSAETRRELDHRSNDGLHVTLFWDTTTDAAVVEVYDAKHDAVFEIAVRSGESALDVFHHPYAYAASRAPAPAELAPA